MSDLKNMPKVIFLDIDGVLCTRRSYLAHGDQGLWDSWDATACTCLSRAIDKHGAKLVISSNWRHLINQEKLLKRLHEHDLHKHLLTGSLEGSCTPDLTLHEGFVGRGEEIEAFLKANSGITDYRILDDDQSMLEHQLPFCIFTCYDNGMDHGNMRQLLNWGLNSA